MVRRWICVGCKSFIHIFYWAWTGGRNQWESIL